LLSLTALLRAGPGPQGTSPRPPEGEVSVGVATRKEETTGAMAPRELTTAGSGRATALKVVSRDVEVAERVSAAAAAAETEAAASRRSRVAVKPVAAASAEAPRRGGDEGAMGRGGDRVSGWRGGGVTSGRRKSEARGGVSGAQEGAGFI